MLHKDDVNFARGIMYNDTFTVFSAYLHDIRAMCLNDYHLLKEPLLTHIPWNHTNMQQSGVVLIIFAKFHYMFTTICL